MNKKVRFKAVFLFLVIGHSSHVASDDFLEATCRNPDREAYCMALIEGFLSGCSMGRVTAKADAEKMTNSELCDQTGLGAKEHYEAIAPHLNFELGYLDFALYAAARKAYPCKE